MRCLIILIAVMAGVVGQSQGIRKEFDVVSVKPSAPDLNGLMMRNVPAGITFTGVPLRMVMMVAYDVKSFQISGEPDWVRTERWDILAKVDGLESRIPMAQERPMIQALMADRFRLKAHRETKEMPVYFLTVDKKGSKLAANKGAAPQIRNGNGSLVVKKNGMNWFAEWLSRKLGRVVLDKTDLKGEYDYSLEWAPAADEGNSEYTGVPLDAPQPPHPDTNGPSIFTALQEQLGLRLVSRKGPVEIIVIDSVEKPSAN